jgi:hypothetical protein
MTGVELTIKGDIEVLRLQPGDTIVVTVKDPHITSERFKEIHDVIKSRFADHEVIVTFGIDLSVQREEVAA